VKAALLRGLRLNEFLGGRENEKRGFVAERRGLRVVATLRVFAGPGEGSGFEAFDRASRERGDERVTANAQGNHFSQGSPPTRLGVGLARALCVSADRAPHTTS